jgi:hypothetical protein
VGLGEVVGEADGEGLGDGLVEAEGVGVCDGSTEIEGAALEDEDGAERSTVSTQPAIATTPKEDPEKDVGPCPDVQNEDAPAFWSRPTGRSRWCACSSSIASRPPRGSTHGPLALERRGV